MNCLLIPDNVIHYTTIYNQILYHDNSFQTLFHNNLKNNKLETAITILYLFNVKKIEK